MTFSGFQTLTATPSTPWSDTGTLEPRTYLDNKQDVLGFMQGLGLEIPLFGKIYVGGDIRYHTSMRRNFSLTPAGIAGTGLTETKAKLNMFLFNAKIGIQY